MRRINITKYRKDEKQDTVCFGEASVKKGYIFADGDESFYRFIGKNSIYPMLELIHPDDVEEL